MKFYYVYILSNKKDGSFYVGFTYDLRKRFKEHNNGYVQSTKSKKPWNLNIFKA